MTFDEAVEVARHVRALPGWHVLAVGVTSGSYLPQDEWSVKALHLSDWGYVYYWHAADGVREYAQKVCERPPLTHHRTVPEWYIREFAPGPLEPGMAESGDSEGIIRDGTSLPGHDRLHKKEAALATEPSPDLNGEGAGSEGAGSEVTQ